MPSNNRRKIGFLAAILLIVSASCAEQTATSTTPAPATGPLGYDTPWISPGLKNPKLIVASEAQLVDDAPIIGVAVNGEARAYSVSAMSGVQNHVVNDVVSGTPVSVTYCNHDDCARVFTTSGSETPIDLYLGGWSQSKMNIRLDGKAFKQSDKSIPLDDLPFERTTWGEWKEKNPESKLFVGGAAPSKAAVPSDAPTAEPAIPGQP